MNKGRKKKPYWDEDWLRQKIETEGKTLKDLGERFGVTYQTIKHFADKYGIERPGSTKKKSNMRRAKILQDREWLYEQYIVLNKSYDTIADEFNIGKTTVARWVGKHGLYKSTPQQFRGKRSHHRPGVVMSCKICGKKTTQKYTKVANGQGRFCSESCAAKYRYHYMGIGEKIQAGHDEYFSTEEGKRKRVEMGVKSHAVNAGIKRTSIEIKMAEELDKRKIEYIEQYNLGDKFALDFFIPEYNIVIECDGDYWHNLPDVKKRDKSKNAYIKACGFPLFRFWEREINANVSECVDEVVALIDEINVGKKATAGGGEL